jgi:hypothetical protein
MTKAFVRPRYPSPFAEISPAVISVAAPSRVRLGDGEEAGHGVVDAGERANGGHVRMMAIGHLDQSEV